MPSHVSDLSLEEFKLLIHEAVWEALAELLVQDTDTEPQFSPEIAERLRQYRHKKPKGIPIEEVVKELGLDD